MTTPNTGDPNGAIPPQTNAPVNSQGNQSSQQQGQAGTSGQDGKTVPITALHEARGKYQEERTRNQELEGQLNQLKTMVEQLRSGYQQSGYQQPQGYQQTYGQQQQPQNHIMQQFQQAYDVDPAQATAWLVGQTMQHVVQQMDQVNVGVETAINNLRQQNPDFGNYERDVRGYLQQLPLAQRSNPHVVQSAYMYVKGQNIDKILEQKQQEWLQKIQNGEQVQGFPQGGNFNAPPRTDQNGLTQQELATAQVMGLTPEDYAKYKRM